MGIKNKVSDNKEIKVTVIISVYNMEDYLKNCLDSIIGQSLREIEIICVNDSSTDRSKKILESYRKKDDRIRIFDQEHKGAASARNLGIENANGEYLFIIDADDFYEHDAIEKAYGTAVKADADIVVFQSDFFDNKDNLFKQNNWSIMPEKLPHNPFSPEDIPELIFNVGCGWASDKLFRKSMISEYGIRFQEIRTTNDMFFTYYSYVKAKKIFVLEETLGHVRVNAHKSLSVTREKSWDNVYLALKLLKDSLASDGVYEKYKRSFVNWALNLIIWHINTLDRKASYKLREKCYEEFFDELDISGHDEEYFYDRGEYNFRNDIIEGNAKISVIVPVYNTEEYIVECLDSICSQSLRNIEIICVDDHSSDDSVKIIKKYAEHEPRLFLIEGESNSGSGFCRNIAMREAVGEFIAFMDSDDWYPDDRVLEDMYNAAKENDALICGGSFSRSFDGVVSTEFEEKFAKYKFEEPGFIEFSDYQFDYGYTRFIYNTSFIKDNSLFFSDYKRFQDPPFMTKAFSEAGSFYAIPLVVFVFKKKKKKKIWTREALNDVIQGITEEIKRSREKGLPFLHYSSYDRLNTEYFRLIKKKLDFERDPQGAETTQQLLLAAQDELDPEMIGEFTECKKEEYPLRIFSPAEFDEDGKIRRILVSVIVPSYNSEDYIRQCLDSILAQTFREIEVICVDDGSTDDTPWILKEYEKKDSRIRVVEKDHSNAGEARNVGMELANGEYLSFLDADDFFEPHMIERVYECAKAEEADVCMFRSNHYDHNTGEFHDTPWTLRDWEMPSHRPFSSYDVVGKVFNMSSAVAWDKLFRKDFIIGNNILFQSNHTSNDICFTFIALALAERISTVDEVLAHQRVGHMKALAKDVEYCTSCFYKALYGLKQELEERWIYEDFKISFVNWAIDFSLFVMHSFRGMFSDLIRQQLKLRFFEELDVYGMAEEDFYNRDQYNEMMCIMSERQGYDTEEKPKVSVILPIYNVAHYLPLALDSAVYQTLENIEIICVNDGSTDNCLDIINEYAKNDPRIVVITGENRGYGHAMNQGIDAARGEYIAIIEPDDFVDVNMFGRLYEVAVENRLDFVRSDFFRFKHDKYGNMVFLLNRIIQDESEYNTVYKPTDDRKWLNYIMNTWCGIYKKEFLDANDIRHNETPGASYQDNGFYIKTHIFAERVMLLHDTFYMNRRDNPGSSVFNKDKIHATDTEFEMVQDYLEEKGILSDFSMEMAQQKAIGHSATIHRSAQYYKKNYVKSINSKTKQLIKSGYLKKDILGHRIYNRIRKIAADPERYYYEVLENERTITILLTIRPQSRFLRNCLDSIIECTVKSIEVVCIFVKESECDREKKIIQDYINIDDRIVVHKHEESSLGDALISGLKIVKGEYVTFVDADDRYASDSLKKALIRCDKTNADLCVFKEIYPDTETEQPSLFMPSEREVFNREMIKNNIFDWIHAVSYGFICRRDFIKGSDISIADVTNPRYREVLMADLVLNASRIVKTDIYLYHKKSLSMQQMSENSSSDWKSVYEHLMKLKKIVSKTGLDEKLGKELVDYSLKVIMNVFENISEDDKEEFSDFYIREGFKSLDIEGKDKFYLSKLGAFAEYRKMIRQNERKNKSDDSCMISIIVPCTSREESVSLYRNCMKMLYDQTFRNFEIIFVHGGTDTIIPELLNELKGLSEIYNNLTVIKAHKSPRSTALVNDRHNIIKAGIKAAKSSYLYVADGNISLAPECFEILQKDLDAKRPDILYFNKNAFRHKVSSREISGEKLLLYIVDSGQEFPSLGLMIIKKKLLEGVLTEAQSSVLRGAEDYYGQELLCVDLLLNCFEILYTDKGLYTVEAGDRLKNDNLRLSERLRYGLAFTKEILRRSAEHSENGSTKRILVKLYKKLLNRLKVNYKSYLSYNSIKEDDTLTETDLLLLEIADN